MVVSPFPPLTPRSDVKRFGLIQRLTQVLRREKSKISVGINKNKNIYIKTTAGKGNDKKICSEDN